MAAEQIAPRPRPKLVERLEAQRDRHRERARIVRVLYAVAGLTLLLGGIAMLVLPGPAFVVIPIGLAMLSVRFAWAERALVKALEQADKAQDRAREATPMQKAVGVAFTIAGISAAVVLAILFDIPLLPV